METKRRDFLKGAAWMGAAALAADGLAETARVQTGGAMAAYAAPPIKDLRVGVIGLGRGSGAVKRMSMIPGTRVTAVCDLDPTRIANAVGWFDDRKLPRPRVFTGSEEEWKRLVDWDQVDLVYNATPWKLHTPIALYAMEHGKHVVVEVPSALTLEDCWALVEASERTKRHCMQLENCCYGEDEMLALNLVRQGLLGELVHGEGAYIHDLRSHCYGKFGEGGYWEYWRLRYNEKHRGNQYETHGLGPICQDLNINRGDRLDWLVSVDSQALGFKDYAQIKFPADSWQAQLNPLMADMNNTIIKTALGKTILVQHDVANARPYSRINLISGTRGILQSYPLRIALEAKPGGGAHNYDPKFTEEIRQKHMHPLWKLAGEIAKKVGGHGGMDFLMDLRLSYCLQNGLPLDFNVYDLAAWCSLGELTEYSATHRGKSMDIPDFTKGGWKTAKPLGIETVDRAWMGLGEKNYAQDKSALNV